jgi:hypothetical protein
MSSRRSVHCPSCGSGYALAGTLVEALAGKSVTCASCDSSWVPFPATGFWARFRAPRPAPIDLLPYLEKPEPALGATAPARAAAPPAPPLAPPPPAEKTDAMDFGLPPERPLVPDLPAALAGGSVEGTVLNLSAPGRGMQSAGSSPLSGLQVGFVGMDGKFAGKSFRVTKTPTLIGRTTGDLLIVDGQVSGRHAQVDVLGLGHASLKDLATTNGTTVNGRAISTTSLKHGDVVGFGGLQFRFVLRSEPRPGQP